MNISLCRTLVFIIYCCTCCSIETIQGSSTTETDTIEAKHIESESQLENGTSGDPDVNEDAVTTNVESTIEPTVDIQETLKAKDVFFKQENGLLEVAQNSGVAHEVVSPNLDVIHTLAESPSLELQDKADELSVVPTISDNTSHYNSTPDVENNFEVEGTLDNDTLETVNTLENGDFINQTEEFLNKVPSTEPKINITDKEDIPSFSEWTQKQLEEAEKKKEEFNASIQSQFLNGKSSLSGKKRWKNYASPDCGAKIVAANPEAISAGSILTTSRDEYKLNTCTSRIWFVVELCEAIQAKKIELANFELFSSSPKDFSISVSDRFTTRDWSSVGQFTAKDERDIQSFEELNPQIFGKFIKFEMHSHYGSEHYCPISLFRVYGTSEFEVLETENQVNVADDDDDDEVLDSHDGDPPKNLFSSATDAVISIVKKAAEALGNKSNRTNVVELVQNKTAYQYLPLVNSCTTPIHIVVCENCTDLLFGYVYELLSCKSKEISALVHRSFIKQTLYNSQICLQFGLDWQKKSKRTLPEIYKKYMLAFFAPKYIAAMCNIVAIMECKVVLNGSHNATIISHNIENIVSSKTQDIVDNITLEVTAVDATESTSTLAYPTVIDNPDASQIKPTKTIFDDNLNPSDTSQPNEPDEINPVADIPPKDVTQSVSIDEIVSNIDDHTTDQDIDQIELNTTNSNDEKTTPETSENMDEPLDTLVPDISDESSSTVPVTTATPPAQPQQQQKESVFLRLSNRLKALELNMSLSGQYLEELSRRYKKQVEEMQRLLDNTILTFNEENRKKDERSERLEEQIQSLQETVAHLIDEKNSWVNVLHWFIFIIAFTTTVFFCKRKSNTKPTIQEAQNSEVLRRKSTSVITHSTLTKKVRRPSEEAMLINGTYKELLIDNNTEPKKRKRKKGRVKLYKSSSALILTEESPINDDRICRTADCDTVTKIPISDWIEKSADNKIQDIPFVLEESEHSAIEILPANTQSIVEPNPGIFKNNHYVKGKSLSLDDSKTQRTSSTSTLNGSLPESFVELPRREKRNFFKKIFRNLSLK